MSVVYTRYKEYAFGAWVLLASAWGCGTNNSAGNPSSGGSSSTGGSLTGGVVNGGASASGGSVSSAGGAATGGIATGGAATSSATGGKASTGGAPNAGGLSAVGGSRPTGGASAAGGAGTGGAAPTTGGKAAGGAPTGGTNAVTSTSGGSEPTGGTNAAGGSGTQATGGSIPSGGTKAVGGTSAAGGQNTSAGGSSQSTTCPSTVLKSGDSTQTVTVGSSSRTYILHVPSAYKGTTAVPLIVDFHPIGGSDTGEESSSPFKAVTDPEGVITAYPQGDASPNMGAAWDVGPCCVANVDDVAFAKALVAQVETKACIDTKRVYAVGFSMGGGMSHYIACKAADVFAAIAPAAFDLLAGSAPAGNADDCKPSRPIPVLSFRGTADSTAIYGGGYSSVVTGMPITFLGAKACWQKWASIDGCTDTPAYPTVNGSTWECAYYKQCQANVQVGVCINNGGHEYGDGTIGWTFLKQFTLP